MLEGLLALLLDNPTDPSPRHIQADLLEEEGNLAEAEELRTNGYVSLLQHTCTLVFWTTGHKGLFKKQTFLGAVWGTYLCDHEHCTQLAVRNVGIQWACHDCIWKIGPPAKLPADADSDAWG